MNIKELSFWVIGTLTLVYCLVELAFGLAQSSLTLLSDGFHNLSDVISLYIAYWSSRASRRGRSDLNTYGWKRTEILGALTNGIFLVSLSVYISLETIPEIIYPEAPPSGGIVILIAAAGLAINTLGTVVFHFTGQSHGHSHAGGGHGHSHGGGDDHGHAHAEKKEKKKDHGHAHAEKKEKKKDHGHSHAKKKKEEEISLLSGDYELDDDIFAPKEKKEKGHGHSHGDGEAHGHSHAEKKEKKEGHGHSHGDGEGHGHSHGDGEAHGHSHAEKKEKKEKEAHGHSHGDGEAHGHSHGDDAHGHSHAEKKEKKEKEAHGHSHDGDDHGHAHGEPKKKKIMDANVRAVCLHYFGDMVSSFFVLVMGLLIYFFPPTPDHPEKWIDYLDPVTSLLIVVLILVTTLPLLKGCFLILLQRTPQHIDLPKIKNKIIKIKGVMGVHDFHVWQLVDGMIITSLHILVEESSDFNHLCKKIKKTFHKAGIHSSAIQPEFVTIHHLESASCLQNCVKDCSEDWCCKDEPKKAGASKSVPATTSQSKLTYSQIEPL